MSIKRLHRLVAFSVFGYALVLYGSTVARTTSLWDAGEFIASAYGLQVMHPPGSPFYMLLGRALSMFMPAAQVALAVNLLSVLASALTILLAYLIIVALTTWWQGTNDTAPTSRIAIAGGVIGACTFAVTDSFWFNAVEAEVYALSMFFTALVVWLGLRWSALARAEAANGDGRKTGSNRYLVLIAYILGLAISVHLMALLAFCFVALLFYFTRVEQPTWSRKNRVLGLLAGGLVSTLVFGVFYPGVVIWVPTLARQSGAPLLFLGVLVAMLAGGLYYTQRRALVHANLALLCLAAVLAGYSAYALIPIRSTANPPVDLDNPETVESLVPYIKREQYEKRALLKGPTFDNRTGRLDRNDNVRLFPRRNSFVDPGYLPLYARYASDADYFWRYQLGYMYVRYFLWNFSGRAKDEQGAGWITGFSDRETRHYAYPTPSEAASRNAYFALPLLLGLFGMFYHFRRDGRRALALAVLFLATGVGLVFYLDEVPQTPRERDYIYVASYFAFSLWVGIGATGILALIRDAIRRRMVRLQRIALPAVGALLFLAVPGWMLGQNYDDHDRSGRYLAHDFAYNMLMSLDANAILFTNGDNDTYPLWYLQEVEGVRPDVRVVCMSLLNAPWYTKQLRDQWAYDAPPLPISLTDEVLDQMGFGVWKPRAVSLPVDIDRLIKQTEMRTSAEDTSGFESPMRWTLEGRAYAEDVRVLYPADQIVFDVLAGNAQRGWERPVYFAATTSLDSRLNLEPYLQREGLAERVVPIRHDEPFGRIVPDLMLDRLSKFKLTRLDDPDVYFDPTSRGLAGNWYRNTYAFTAVALADQGRLQEAERLLDDLLDAVPPDTIPLTFYEAYPLTQTYRRLGNDARALALWRYAEPYVLRDVRSAANTQQLQQAVQQAQHIQLSYTRAGAFEDAAALGNRLADLLNDEAFRLPPEEFEKLYQEMMQPSSPDSGAG